MKIDFKNLTIDYEPYPIGVASKVFNNDIYQKLLESFPDISNFSVMRKTKFSFNQRDSEFRKFVSENSIWQEFGKYINSYEFVDSVFNILKKKNIDLGFNNYILCERGKKTSKIKKVYEVLRGYRHPIEIETKFEFSALHANGGAIWPHTDSKNKIITLVLSMVEKNGWETKWGGGTSSVFLKNNTKVFDRTNKYKPDFDDIETIKTYDFNANQCLLFVKTFNSWHAVMPMKNPNSNALRKSITINIIQR